MEKGLVGVMNVVGPDNADTFRSNSSPDAASGH
jgi:hypothetical protein